MVALKAEGETLTVHTIPRQSTHAAKECWGLESFSGRNSIMGHSMPGNTIEIIYTFHYVYISQTLHKGNYIKSQ